MFIPKYVTVESDNKVLTRYFMLQQAAYFTHKLVEVQFAHLRTTPERVMALWLIDKKYVKTPADIAKIMFKENQSVAGLLNRMEAEGLVQRIKKAQGNKTFLKLTKKGRKEAELMERVSQYLETPLSPPVRSAEQLWQNSWLVLHTVRDQSAAKLGYKLQADSVEVSTH